LKFIAIKESINSKGSKSSKEKLGNNIGKGFLFETSFDIRKKKKDL